VSRAWDVWCLDCNTGHGFDQANHEHAIMAGLAKSGPVLAPGGAVLRALEGLPGHPEVRLFLRGDWLELDLEWFELHGSHRLAARDEYGHFDEEPP
jgi:hypothetical protein